MASGGETLRLWVKKAEQDSGRNGGLPPEVNERVKALERENRELRQANEILRKASAYFPSGSFPVALRAPWPQAPSALAELDRRVKS